jgi:hypothetical protein
MRRLGMIVDIDHMSERSAQETLAHYGPLDYPVVSAHATFRELSPRRHVADEAHPRVFASGVLERAHHSMWPHESEKTSSVLSALASLRGMIAPITGGLQESSPHGHQVANDSAGTSKTWAQEFLYARSLMGNRGIGLGTDAVALLDQPGARFGPQASWGLHKEPNSVPRRRDQANTQMRGVTYDGHILDYRAHRFSHSDVYDQEERDIWEATAIVKAGVNPWLSDQQPDGPGIFSRTWVVQNKINNIAKGFLATSEAQLERPSLGSDAHAEQRAAFLVARDSAAATPGANPPMLPVTEDARVRELFPRIWRIWDMWARMERGADGTPNNIPLQRSVAGRRDFDINIDGVAHYGMLTDFLQDLKNVGLAPADMSVLLRSAEDYIEVWERCEFVRTGVQPASMRRRQSGSAVGG